MLGHVGEANFVRMRSNPEGGALRAWRWGAWMSPTSWAGPTHPLRMSSLSSCNAAMMAHLAKVQNVRPAAASGTSTCSRFSNGLGGDTRRGSAREGRH